MATTIKCHMELRVDEYTDQLITAAAELLHTTKSAFVTDAARQAALQSQLKLGFHSLAARRLRHHGCSPKSC